MLVKVGAGNLLNTRQEIYILNQLARRDKMMNSEQRRICKDVVMVCLKVVQCLGSRAFLNGGTTRATGADAPDPALWGGGAHIDMV